MKLTAPDFKCQNTSCGWLQWPLREKLPTQAPQPHKTVAVAAQTTGILPPPAPKAADSSTSQWDMIWAFYGRCEHQARRYLKSESVDLESDSGRQELAVLTNSLLYAAVAAGLKP